MVFTHYWRLRQFLPNRHGMLCRVIAASRRGKPVPACAIANPPAPKNMGIIYFSPLTIAGESDTLFSSTRELRK